MKKYSPQKLDNLNKGHPTVFREIKIHIFYMLLGVIVDP